MKGIRLLLLFFPVAVAAELLHWGDLVIFATSALAIIPIAGLLGEATEALAEKTGPQLGGLLNASLGNAAELIITIVAITAGKMELVKASIIGSILGNLLFVLGLSLLLGGIKHGSQRFDRSRVSLDGNMVILAAIAISIPSLFNELIEPNFQRVETLSLTTAAVVLVLYVLSIIYTLRQPVTNHVSHGASIEPSHAGPHWSVSRALLIMVAAVAGLAVMSEYLVGSLEVVTETFGLSEFFVGIILVPIIGNVAEHLVAVQVAMKNQMDLSLSIALGSSLQIALFVAPLLVFISLFLGNPMTLEFNHPEVLAMVAASIIAAFVAVDGRSNWLEGAMLIAVYLILGIGFFFLPAMV
ncbi:MAG: calcium/proton exchanger [Caldilinea sp.]|uniref:calcium/proton exchanger n=1 Tax=Caldilinea sp. TaxID=2293560 RepID=UPI002CBE9FB4|nr:calcium/proton exchanger [Caldilinea sp.]